MQMTGIMSWGFLNGRLEVSFACSFSDRIVDMIDSQAVEVQYFETIDVVHEIVEISSKQHYKGTTRWPFASKPITLTLGVT